MGKAGFGVQTVVREIWELFVLLGELLWQRDVSDV